MSLFGKLLAIFNVLAAIAFVCVGVLDYSQRQAWSYAVLRSDTFIQGLPFDETELTLDGDKRFEQLDSKALTDIFSNAGGNPQPTQLAEVRRVQGTVNTFLARSPSPQDKEIEDLRAALVEDKTGTGGGTPIQAVLRVKSLRLGSQLMQLEREIDLEKRTKNRPDVVTALENEHAALLKKKNDLDADIQAFSKKDGLETAAVDKLKTILQVRRLSTLLLPFASSSVEYEEFADGMASSELKPLGGLQGKLTALFDEVISGQVKANELAKGNEQAVVPNHKLNLDERKLAAARLLFNLIGAVPNSGYAAGPTGLQRVIAVCGLANTAHAVQAQTVALNKIAQDLNYTLDRERSDFVTEAYRVMGRSQDLADELRKQQLYLRAQEDLVSRQTDLVKALEVNIQKLKDWLAAAQNTTQEKLAEQEKMENSLFDARKKLRDTQMLNQKLEEQIRELEKAKSP